jgi:hypothetical protein
MSNLERWYSYDAPFWFYNRYHLGLRWPIHGYMQVQQLATPTPLGLARLGPGR